MSREILFKAKRKDWRELPKEEWWVEGYYVLCRKHRYILPIVNKNIGYDEREDEWVEIDPETICQYTGLTDKNGKRIWENDVVICKQEVESNHMNYSIEIGFVEMDYGAFGLHRKQGFYRPFKDWLEDYEYEVQGNIFDDPELLEEKR